MLFGSLWLSQFLARKKSSTYQTTEYVGEASAKSDSYSEQNFLPRFWADKEDYKASTPVSSGKEILRHQQITRRASQIGS